MIEAPDALPRVLVIAPGSGHCGRALRRSHALHIAADPLYDMHGRRYPPGWVHMHQVALDEQEAAASGIDLNQIGFARASPRNLATWAGCLFDPEARTIACVDVSLLDIKPPLLDSGGGGGGGGSGEWTAATVAAAEAVSQLQHDDAVQLVRPVAEAAIACLVCGSRGGQVTLPALWRLGCRLPVVVVNGGCCRAEVAWAWPEGVPVVLVTGGHDFFNEHLWAPGMWDIEADLAYRRELWAAVPLASRATTAILHLPKQPHQFGAVALHALLPQAVAYAASGLAAAACPDGFALPEGEPLLIISANTAPDGDLLRGTLDAPPPLPPPPPPPPAQGASSDSWAAGCLQQCLQMGRPTGRRARG